MTTAAVMDVCVDCGGPKTPGKVRCRACWKAWNAAMAGSGHPRAKPGCERWTRSRRCSPEHRSRMRQAALRYSLPTERDDVERFLAKVDPWSAVPCWLWKGSKDADGYGVFRLHSRGNNVRAHHFAVRLATGDEVPKGATVMHSCDRPGCVYPRHLTVATPAENRADCIAKGRDARGARHWSKTRPEEFKAHMARIHALRRASRGE